MVAEQISSRSARENTIVDALAGSTITAASVRMSPLDGGEGRWVDIGHLVEGSLMFGPTPEDLELAERAAAMRRHPAGRAWTATIDSFRALGDAAHSAGGAFDMFVGALGPVEPPRASVRIEYSGDGAPRAPRKRRGLTGRRYRAARRRYAREMRAWRKAGRPRQHTAIILPRVEMRVGDMIYTAQHAATEDEWTNPAIRESIIASLKYELEHVTRGVSVPQPTRKVPYL